MREKLGFYLQDIETPVGRFITFIITGLVLLSSAIFVAETYPIPEKNKLILEGVNVFILICFSIEYILRFWCADHKIKFIFSPYSLIDLVVILPFFIREIDFSFIFVFRWFRILRLIRFLNTKTFFGKINTEDTVIIARILFTLFSIIFVYSGLIYQVEHRTNPQDFATFLDAVYFSVVTMTTVGFGDVTPISETGRLLTVLMILTGISLIPWQLGDLIKQLVNTANNKQSLCSGCGLMFHDTDAQFCKRCGTSLKQK